MHKLRRFHEMFHMTRVLVEVVCIESIVATGRSRSIFLADGPGISGMRCASVLMGVVSLDSVLVGTAVCSYMYIKSRVRSSLYAFFTCYTRNIYLQISKPFIFLFQHSLLPVPGVTAQQLASTVLYRTLYCTWVNETIQNNYKNNDHVKVLFFLSFFDDVHVRSDELK